MARAVTEQQQRNRAEQTRLYGAPLGDLLGDVSDALEISQSRLARLLGVSAPMVSQLASGHRVKIGNPTAVVRLQRMIELSREVHTGWMNAETALERLDTDQTGQILTRASQLTLRQGAAEVQQVLRAVASATEILQAAELLEAQHAELAEVLRVYGAGRSDEAVAHYERTVLR